MPRNSTVGRPPKQSPISGLPFAVKSFRPDLPRASWYQQLPVKLRNHQNDSALASRKTQSGLIAKSGSFHRRGAGWKGGRAERQNGSIARSCGIRSPPRDCLHLRSLTSGRAVLHAHRIAQYSLRVWNRNRLCLRRFRPTEWSESVLRPKMAAMCYTFQRGDSDFRTNFE